MQRGAYGSTLPPQALKYVNTRAILDVIAVTVVVAALIMWLAPEQWRLPAVVILVLLLIAGLAVDLPFINRLSVRSTSYELDQAAVRIRRGILISRDTVISTAQLLNVTIVQGPLLRRFGLVKIAFTTIANVEPLGPLSADEAESLRVRALAWCGGTVDDGAV